MNKDFSYYLSKFLKDYLVIERNVSKNTIRSYTKTFQLLIDYLVNNKKITLNNITFNTITRNIIIDFLNHLEENIYSSENDNLLLLLDQIIKNNTPIRDPNVEPMELYITTGKKYINTNYNHFLDLSSISFQLEGIGNELEEIFPEYDTNIHRKILEII